MRQGKVYYKENLAGIIQKQMKVNMSLNMMNNSLKTNPLDQKQFKNHFYKHHNQVRKQINNELRQIRKELQIKTEITSYVALHSFAKTLKNSGVNIALISEALGNSKLSTTPI